jgi:hypothetical protein
VIAVECTLPEALGALASLGPDGSHSMTAEECDAAAAFRDRLERAVRVETGPGGSEAHGEQPTLPDWLQRPYSEQSA